MVVKQYTFAYALTLQCWVELSNVRIQKYIASFRRKQNVKICRANITSNIAKPVLEHRVIGQPDHFREPKTGFQQKESRFVYLYFDGFHVLFVNKQKPDCIDGN